jgi:hypothetical protein
VRAVLKIKNIVVEFVIVVGVLFRIKRRIMFICKCMYTMVYGGKPMCRLCKKELAYCFCLLTHTDDCPNKDK